MFAWVAGAIDFPITWSYKASIFNIAFFFFMLPTAFASAVMGIPILPFMFIVNEQTE